MTVTAGEPDVGTAVQKIRKVRRMTQAQLAEAADLTTKVIQQVEGNYRNPSEQTLLQICKALNVPTTFIHTLADASDDPIVAKCKMLVEKSLALSSERPASK